MGATPTLPHVIGNKISTTLASGINNSTLTIPLTSGVGLNTTGGYIIVDKGTSTEEIIYLESVSGSTGTASSDGRGSGGTSAFSHSSGATVYDVLVSTHIEGSRSTFLTEHNLDGTHTTNVDKTVDNTKAFKGKDSGGTARNIGNVTSGDFLEIGDTNLNGITPYLKLVASAFQSASGQTISTATITQVTLDGENFDPGADFASNSYTAPVTGYYLVVAQITFDDPGAAHALQGYIYVNGAQIKKNISTSIAAVTQSIQLVGLVNATATQTIDIRAYHEKGSNLALLNGAINTYLDIFFVSK